MNTNSNQDQEIDLTQVLKKIGGFFDSIAMAIFKGILFVKKYILIFIVLFIVGAGLGYYLDYSTKTYKHDIIVSPNFGSLDYLYNKVNLIKSRIQQKDTLFLKSIGISDPQIISNITMSPSSDNNFTNSKFCEFCALLATAALLPTKL